MPPAASSHDDFEGDDWSKAGGHRRKNKGTTVALVSSGPSARAGQQAITGGAVNVVSAINGGISQANAARFSSYENRREQQAYQTPEADYYRAFQKIHKDSITNDVILRFHKTDILKVKRNGDVVLNTGGYHTYTTLCSINDALQFIDMKIKVLGEVKDPDNWLVTGTGGYNMPYSDMMVIPARGPTDVDRGMEVFTGMRALLQSTSEAAAETHRNAPTPPRAPLMVANKAQQADQASKPAPKPAAAVAPSRPPPVIPPPQANGATPPVAAGSAWAAKGSLAAKLAAETEFPPLGGEGASKQTAAAAAAAKPATTQVAAAAASTAGAKAVPAAAAAPAKGGKPAAAAAAGKATAAATQQQASRTQSGASTASASAVPSTQPVTTTPQPTSNPAAPVTEPAVHAQLESPIPAPYTAAATQANAHSLFSQPPPSMHPYAPYMPPAGFTPGYGGTAPGYGAATPGFETANYMFGAPAQPYLPDSLDECYGMGVSLGGGVRPSSVTPPVLTNNTSPIQSSTTSSICSAGLFSPHNGVPAVPTVQQPSKAISELFAQQDDGLSGDDVTLCVICMHHKSTTIMVPCSHAILCKGCADMVMNCTGAGADTAECPLCRCPIDLVLDVQ